MIIIKMIQMKKEFKRIMKGKIKFITKRKIYLIEIIK